MTEGSATRMKRNGARLFKNPPQPHMCIQDFVQGITAPCYVNVLSWEKIAMPCRPSRPFPLYGGMRVRPPRTKAEAVVFAVMANPEVLRTSGKNCEDPKKRSTFVEVLLDFVEAMNNGIVFTRRYTILKDRDITGELKEVWNAVQARRDWEQLLPQQETWIDAQPLVPQYPQYQEQQQQQQPQQQEYTPQPPQYHTSVAYNRAISGEGMHYEGGYGHQPPNSVIPQNDQMYPPGQMVQQQQYHKNDPRIAQDRYNYRERGRENLVQNIPQQNCPAYPAPYQFQQLRRQMAPQYVNSNVHQNQNLNYGPPVNTNINPAMNTNLAPIFQPYVTYKRRMVNNSMHVEIRRMPPPQPQQPQIHMNHVQPVPQYDSTPQYGVQPMPMNATRLNRPHMGVAQKNNASKRQINSPTRSKSPSCTNCQTKEPDLTKSPVKVLQREVPQVERPEANNVSSAENNKPTSDNTNVEELQNLQVTDLDEDTKSSTNSNSPEPAELPVEPNDVSPTDTVVPSTGPNATSCSEETSQTEERQQESKDVDILNGQNSSDQKTSKSKVFVIKVHKLKENTESNKTVKTRAAEQKPDNQKFSQTTVNILKSVFKMHPGMSGEDTTSKRRTNGQAKGTGKSSSENEEAQPGYTILKKSESTAQEELVNEIAQISIQDCKDTTEVSPVLS